jgi:hypothetical protein
MFTLATCLSKCAVDVKSTSTCKDWEFCPLRCIAVQSFESRPTFQRSVSLPSSGSKNKASRQQVELCVCFFCDLLFDPEVGGDMLPRNVDFQQTAQFYFIITAVRTWNHTEMIVSDGHTVCHPPAVHLKWMPHYWCSLCVLEARYTTTDGVQLIHENEDYSSGFYLVFQYHLNIRLTWQLNLDVAILSSCQMVASQTLPTLPKTATPIWLAILTFII